MRIFIIGDPHFKKSNKKETDNLISDCLEIFKREVPDFIVILGDVYDNGEYVYHGCIMRVYNMITTFKAICPVYILIGNHDRPNNKVFLTNEHPFNDWKDVPGVTIVDRCHTMEWKCKKICMMPYVPNGMFHKACQECNVNIRDFDIFFCHQEFKYCDTNMITGSECDEWLPDYPLNVAGHIHKKQTIKGNLFYVGTPFQTRFGEDTDKGVYFLDENLDFEQIELTIPKKVEISIHYTEIDKLLDVDPNSTMKIVITGPKETIKEILKRPEFAEKIGNAIINYKDNTKIRKCKNEVLVNTPFEERLKILLKNEKKRKLFREVFPDL